MTQNINWHKISIPDIIYTNISEELFEAIHEQHMRIRSMRYNGDDSQALDWIRLLVSDNGLTHKLLYLATGSDGYMVGCEEFRNGESSGAVKLSGYGWRENASQAWADGKEYVNLLLSMGYDFAPAEEL